MKKIIFDVECLENCFIVCLKNIDSGKRLALEISERKNEAKQFKNIFNLDNKIFFGFNNMDYDSPLVNFVLKNESLNWDVLCLKLKEISDKMIKDKVINYRLKYANNFQQIDLLRMLFSKELRVSLKELQVSMNYPNVLEMDVDWDAPIDVSLIDDLISYCWNDVDSTEWVYDRCKEDLKFRSEINKEWGIDCFSSDGMTLGVQILKEEFKTALGLEEEDFKKMGTKRESIVLNEIILPFIKYESKELQELLTQIKGQVLTGDAKFSYKVVYDDLEYTIGRGGIHSVNTPTLYIPEDYLIIDGDVDSQYPASSLNFHFGPEHLGEDFFRVFGSIRDRRIEAKKRRKENSRFELINNTFKLSLNGAIGNFLQPFSWLADPKANVSITLNNQLLILKWAEMLTLIGCKIQSANTDGLTTLVPKNKVDAYYKVCEEFCNISKFTLEFVEYEKLVTFAVNDYLAVKRGGGIKQKGALFLEGYRLGKGKRYPEIICRALNQYYINNIPVEDTINNCVYLPDFTRFEKTGKQFKVYYGEKRTQLTNRFYVSLDGDYLNKRKLVEKVNKNTGEKTIVESKTAIMKNIRVSLANKYTDDPFESYNVDKQYYMDAANEILRQFKIFKSNFEPNWDSEFLA